MRLSEKQQLCPPSPIFPLSFLNPLSSKSCLLCISSVCSIIPLPRTPKHTPWSPATHRKSVERCFHWLSALYSLILISPYRNRAIKVRDGNHKASNSSEMLGASRFSARRRGMLPTVLLCTVEFRITEQHGTHSKMLCLLHKHEVVMETSHK